MDKRTRREVEITRAISDCGWSGHPTECGSDLVCPKCLKPIENFECAEPEEIPLNG